MRTLLARRTLFLAATALAVGTAGVSLVVAPGSAFAQSAVTVAVTSPQAGGVLTGTSATLEATATPTSGNSIICVSFYLNGSDDIADTCSPSSGSATGQGTYAASWNASQSFSQGVQQLTAVAQDSSGASSTSAPVEVVVDPGQFIGVTPYRVLDTRTGTGVYSINGNFQPSGGAVASHETVDLQVSGQGGVPSSGVSAFVLNVTVTEPQQGGYLTVFPYGASQPTASNLNFVGSQTVANLVTVGDGTGGYDVSIYNGSPGTVQIVADVVGYYTDGSTDTTSSAGRLVGLTPARVLDTRNGTGGVTGPIQGDQVISFPVLGQGGVPSSGVAGVVFNLTETDPTAAGYLTAWPSEAGQPLASSLNFTAGETVPNLVELPVDASGKVSIYNGSPGTVQLVADVVGYYTDSSAPAKLSGLYTALQPSRILDTRFGTGAPTAPLGPHATLTLQVTGAGDVPAAGVAAVALNVTVTAPQQPGYLTVFPTGGSQPLASNLNFVPGQTVPNLVISAVNAQGQVSIYNGSGGSIEVVADAQGFFG